MFLFFLINGLQALYINPGCLKCISSANVFPANKSLFTIPFILYYSIILSNMGIPFKGDDQSEFFTITLHILIKALIFLYLSLFIYTSCIFHSSKNLITLFYEKIKTFDEQLKSYNFIFLSSHNHFLLTHYLLKQIHHD